MNDQAVCAQCGAARPDGAAFCPSCGRPYGGDEIVPVAWRGTNLATAAGVAWLVSAAFTGYFAYQQWTLYRAFEAAGQDAGDWGAIAAWNAFSCLITLYFGTRILLRPGRSLLTWSVVWAAITVVGGVAQFGSDVGDVFAVAVITAGVAGVLSYVGRAAFVDPPTEVPPPVPAAPSAPPTTPPPATPAPPPVAAAAPMVVGFRPPAPVPATPSPDATLPIEERPERVSPVLIIGVVLSGLLAIAVMGFAVLSGPGSPLLGGVRATPSPVVPATPTPRPTPTPVPPGEIVFGLEYDPGSLLIAAPRTRFKTTFHPIAWSAALNGPVDSTELDLVISRRSAAGVETTLHGETLSISNVQAELIAASTDFGALVGAQEGDYVMRLFRDNHVIAQGTFTLVR